MAEREITALKRAYGLKISPLARPWRAAADSGEVTYCVLPPPPGSPAPAQQAVEKRRARRRRTRLRSGKILDQRNGFLIDARIIDRSASGLRLRLARDSAIPDVFHLFDDETQIILIARVVWRRQALIGARIDPAGPARATQQQIASLRGKFYAMKD